MPFTNHVVGLTCGDDRRGPLQPSFPYRTTLVLSLPWSGFPSKRIQDKSKRETSFEELSQRTRGTWGRRTGRVSNTKNGGTMITLTGGSDGFDNGVRPR